MLTPIPLTYLVFTLCASSISIYGSITIFFSLGSKVLLVFSLLNEKYPLMDKSLNSFKLTLD